MSQTTSPNPQDPFYRPPGDPPLRKKFTMAMSHAMFERIRELAAATGLTEAGWCRAVFESAFELYDMPADVQEQYLGAPSGPALLPDLPVSTVEQQDFLLGQALRVPEGSRRPEVLGSPVPSLVTERSEEQKKVNPRDCPHLFQWREGGRCQKCGGRIPQTQFSR